MGITRYILPVVVGAMSAMVLITLGQTFWIGKVYPLPTGIDQADKAELANAMAGMPATAYVLLLVNYALCSFIAGIIATLVAGRKQTRPAIVVGIVLTLAGLYNLINLPHPAWFAVLNVVVYLPFTYSGYLASRKRNIINR